MAIYKINNVYYVDISFGGKRIRKSTGETLERKAWRIHEELLDDLKNGNYLEGQKNIEFSTLSKIYIDDALKLLNYKTQRDYIRYINNFQNIIGNLKINDIGKSELHKLVLMLKEKSLSTSAIRGNIFAISAVFAYGVKIGLIDKNPVASFDKSYIPTDTGRIRFLTKIEFDRLIENCSYELLKQAIILAVETGFRKEELLSLKWEHEQVDFQSKEITLWYTKNKEHRTIPMSPVVYNVLQNLYENRDSNCEYVIQLRGKRVLDFKRSFNNALKKANIQDLHWHDLRHTFATWALKGWFSWQTKPFDIYRLQKWLGHKNIKTTQRYAHLETADLHSLINFK